MPPTAFLPLPENGAPEITPGARMSVFSGERGSAPLGTSLRRWYDMAPMPPRWVLYQSSGGLSSAIFSLVRSTLRVLPLYPNGVDRPP